MLWTILIVVLIIVLLGGVAGPRLNSSLAYGYGAGHGGIGVIGVILIIVVIVWLVQGGGGFYGGVGRP
jgi:Protein of unknown function (DUF3309)